MNLSNSLRTVFDIGFQSGMDHGQHVGDRPRVTLEDVRNDFVCRDVWFKHAIDAIEPQSIILNTREREALDRLLQLLADTGGYEESERLIDRLLHRPLGSS